MKERVQDKINRVRELAKTSVKEKVANAGGNFRSADSLSHVVRNAKEANVFLEELEVAIRISKKNRNFIRIEMKRFEVIRTVFVFSLSLLNKDLQVQVSDTTKAQ